MAKLKGAEEYLFYYGANPEGLRLAGDLRYNMTSAEKLLWEQVRNSIHLPRKGEEWEGLKELQPDYGLQWYDYKITFPDINFMLYDHIF